MDRPLLLIDIDGVLNPLNRGTKPKGFEPHTFLGFEVWLWPEHGVWLRSLANWFDLVWATTWEHHAHLIGAVLDLPQDLPVIEFDRNRKEPTWKLHDVRRFVGDRSLAWIDDDLWSDAEAWAASRDAATLLVRVPPHRGLTQKHVSQLEAFGRAVVVEDELEAQ